jgi:hypothetical protein
MRLKLVKNEPKFYEFIRILRTDENNVDGFLEKVQITSEQQIKYMEKYSDCYFICLNDETPVGFIGVIDDDIRVCTDHIMKGKGIGHFMLTELIKIFPNSKAKILKNNVASMKLFNKLGYKIYDSDDKIFYLNYDVQKSNKQSL